MITRFALALALAACAPAPIPGPAPEPPPAYTPAPDYPPARAPSGPGGPCDGFMGQACGPGLYCRHQPGVCLNTADAQGQCTPRPQVCTRILQPVCGCDGRTYGNPCEAAAARPSMGRMGRCEGERP